MLCKNTVIPQGVATIGFGAFKNCTSLKSISIPDSVTYIDNHAFEGCTNLRSITFTGVTPPEIRNYILDDCTSLTTIYVPAGTKDAYITALGSDFASKIVEK